MSIVRAPHDRKNPYVMINKEGINENMSWESKGLWVYLLSKPDDWVISVAHLSEVYKVRRGGGEKSIYRMLNELIEEGYCTRVKEKGKTGKFLRTSYQIHEFKIKVPHSPERRAVERQVVSGGPSDNILNTEYKEKIEKAPKGAVVSPIGLRLASYFLQKIKEFKPDVLAPKSLDKWAAEIDRMMKIDKRSEATIEEVMNWLAKNVFMRKYVLSIAKLREKFDQLEISMRDEKNKAGTNDAVKCNKDFVIHMKSKYKSKLNHIECNENYVLDIFSQKDIYYKNHTPEQFKDLFLQMINRGRV